MNKRFAAIIARFADVQGDGILAACKDTCFSVPRIVSSIVACRDGACLLMVFCFCVSLQVLRPNHSRTRLLSPGCGRGDIRASCCAARSSESALPPPCRLVREVAFFVQHKHGRRLLIREDKCSPSLLRRYVESKEGLVFSFLKLSHRVVTPTIAAIVSPPQALATHPHLIKGEGIAEQLALAGEVEVRRLLSRARKTLSFARFVFACLTFPLL